MNSLLNVSSHTDSKENAYPIWNQSNKLNPISQLKIQQLNLNSSDLTKIKNTIQI